MLIKFENYLKELETSPHTIRNYLSDLRLSISEDIIDCNLSSLDLGLIIKLNKSSSYKHRIRAAIKKYARFLVHSGYLNHVPNEIDTLSLPTITNKFPRITKFNYTQKLLDKIDNLEIKTIIIMLATTGCRISSLASLKIEDIQGNEIVFHTSKNNKPYKTLLVEKARQVLKTYIDDRTSGFLFRKADDSKYTPDGLRMKLIRALGEDYINPHSLRHGFATELIENDVDIFTVKNMMQHENISTTQRYIHLSTEFLNQKIKGKIEFLS